MLFVPVIVMTVIWGRRNGRDTRSILGAMATSFAVAVATFVVLTPGAVLEPHRFLHDFSSATSYYRKTTGLIPTDVPHLVRSFPSYLWDLTKYLALSLPSRSGLMSLTVMALCAIGVYAIARRDRWLAVALFAPCIIMLLYYSTLHVFIVRNFLIFLPFIALFAGAGLDQLLRAIHRIELRTTIAVVAFLPFVFGTVALAHAAETIAHRSTASTVRAAMQWIRQHPHDRFEVTANVAKEAELASTPLPPNADRQPGARYLVFWLSDLRLGPWLQVVADPATAGGFQPTWTANQRATFRVFGPQEVDFNFYPDWAGDDRILIMPAQQAAQAGVTPDKLFKPATPYCCRVPPRGSHSAFDLAAVVPPTHQPRWRQCLDRTGRDPEPVREASGRSDGVRFARGRRAREAICVRGPTHPGGRGHRGSQRL